MTQDWTGEEHGHCPQKRSTVEESSRDVHRSRRGSSSSSRTKRRRQTTTTATAATTTTTTTMLIRDFAVSGSLTSTTVIRPFRERLKASESPKQQQAQLTPEVSRPVEMLPSLPPPPPRRVLLLLFVAIAVGFRAAYTVGRIVVPAAELTGNGNTRPERAPADRPTDQSRVSFLGQRMDGRMDRWMNNVVIIEESKNHSSDTMLILYE